MSSASTIFNPNTKDSNESSGGNLDLSKIVGSFQPPNAATLNSAGVGVRDKNYKVEIPTITLPDFKDLIPDFKF